MPSTMHKKPRGFRNDLSGRTYGRLTVLSFHGQTQHKNALWLCRCECGNTAIVLGHELVANGTRTGTRSCGCLKMERDQSSFADLNKTHDMSGCAEYKIWCGMKTRCFNRASNSYHLYGGRGITICDRWLHSFEAFYADMGPRPSSAYAIERIDNDGPYSPDNCKWLLKAQQAANRRMNVILTHDGLSLTVAEWSRRLGVSYRQLIHRYYRGWPVDQILNVTLSLKQARRIQHVRASRYA